MQGVARPTWMFVRFFFGFFTSLIFELLVRWYKADLRRHFYLHTSSQTRPLFIHQCIHLHSGVSRHDQVPANIVLLATGTICLYHEVSFPPMNPSFVGSNDEAAAMHACLPLRGLRSGLLDNITVQGVDTTRMSKFWQLSNVECSLALCFPLDLYPPRMSTSTLLSYFEYHSTLR